jgi:acetoin utilization protein AcuB
MPHVVDDFMTRAVHTIGTKSPLSEAHRLMNDHAIRHLPVLEGGRLVGVVSMRDLHLIETLEGVDPKEVTVEEAMSQDAYTVSPGTELAAVARTMAQHKYGSAVVARGGHVEGIFTTIDALKALEAILSSPRQPSRTSAPREAVTRKSTRAATKRPAGKRTAKSPARKVAPARKRGGRR